MDSRGTGRKFQAAVAALVRDVFRKDDPNFWFSQVYNHYKRFVKPQGRFKKLQPWVTGDRSLDLGCGNGLTALVLAVLNPVTTEDLIPLLAELRRVSRRVILEEGSYLVPSDIQAYGEQSQAQWQELAALPAEDQLRSLMFVDYFSSAIPQRLPEMPMPFYFQTVDEWQAIFVSQGFSLERTLRLGLQSGYFNRSCQIWFVRSSKPPHWRTPEPART